MEPFGSEVLWPAVDLTFGTFSDALKAFAVTFAAAAACWYLLRTVHGAKAVVILAGLVALSTVLGFNVYKVGARRDAVQTVEIEKRNAAIQRFTEENGRLSAELYPPIELYERNAERWSWNGRRYPPGDVRLDGSTPLEVTVGEFQPLNAAVKSPDDTLLRGVLLHVNVPRGFEVRHGSAWTPDGLTAEGKATYSTPIGTIQPGAIVNGREAFYFKAPEAGSFFVGYDISSFNASPVPGGFPVIAKERAGN
jgi:hypothetical protein